MKYLLESDEWRRKTDNKELYDLSLDIDDMLFDIKDDEGYDSVPFIQPSFISKDRIMIELVGNINGERTPFDEFTITPVIKSTLERIYNYIKSNGYEIKITLNYVTYNDSLQNDINFIDGDWFIFTETDAYGRRVLVKNQKDRPVDLLKETPDYITILINKKS